MGFEFSFCLRQNENRYSKHLSQSVKVLFYDRDIYNESKE